MKIEAKSLMQGNIVNSPHGYIVLSEVGRAHVLGCLTVNPDSGHMGVCFDEIQPIPLSPSLLEAAGFVRENMVATTYVTYTHEDIEGWLDLYFEAHTVRFGISDFEVANCQYLHQLQNLCSSLGHELTIDL